MAHPEDLRAKLARLRREPSPARAEAAADVPPTPAPIPRLPEHLRARLMRARPPAAAASGQGGGAADDAPTQGGHAHGHPLVGDPPRTVGPPADLVVEAGPRGPFAARTTGAQVQDSHGAWRYAEARAVDPDVFALLTGDPTLGAVDLSRAVYLDTETTGLEGGAGTYVFLVGLGWFEGERFVVQQSFLRGPEDEAALLAAVAERIAAAPAVVSFFGKVFDRHRLEDKMRVHGVTPPFAGRAHLDLCFPFRRLTKGALPNARLQTMERHLVGLERSDDMPGALAPAAWFDYLADRAHRLEGVFRHNLDDVRSLVILAAYLGRVTQESRATGAQLAGPPAQRALALARAFADRREDARALEWYARLFAPPLSEAGLAEGDLDRARIAVGRLERRLARSSRAAGAARTGRNGLNGLNGRSGEGGPEPNGPRVAP
ncbi:MAG: ribonuclease H-like domain-containing protein [Planctomycetota bacterium]